MTGPQKEGRDRPALIGAQQRTDRTAEDFGFLEHSDPRPVTLGEQDKAKYLAIGESDRMTLRFVKPAAPASAASAH